MELPNWCKCARYTTYIRMKIINGQFDILSVLILTTFKHFASFPHFVITKTCFTIISKWVTNFWQAFMMCVELFPIVNILYRRSTHLLFRCLKSNICYILHSHTHLLSQFRKKIGKYFLFERHESLWNRTTMNNIIRVPYVDKRCKSENKLSKNNFIYIPSWYLYIQPSHRYNDFYSTAI